MSELQFEAALSKLEETVRRLESGDLTLEQALGLFQDGVGLVKMCQERLQAAENQVEILIQEMAAQNSDKDED